MRNIFKRIYKMARAEGAYRLKKFGDLLFGDIEREARDNANRWSSNSGSSYSRGNDGFSGGNQGGKTRPGGTSASHRASGIPKQVAEDLAVFNLRHPCTWEEVRKARNREIKKYHSDRFLNDAERYKTSKEIMQIYNAAFDRLKAYYKAR